MRRLARFLLYLGVVAVVLGLSKVHASQVADPPYDYTGSSRFAWSFAYMVILAVTAYGTGLPDLPRSRRSAVASSIAAAAIAAAGISIVQLFVGDALLPRFVVFGAAILLVPWYLLCTALAWGTRTRAADLDRVLVLASAEEAATLEADLERHPERPAKVVATCDPRTVDEDDLREIAEHRNATVVVLDREAQQRAAVVDAAAALHESGLRVRTLSLFYEEWLGKLPLSELERVSLMFDIGELHRARYGRATRLFDVGLAVCGLVVLVLVIPFVAIGDVVANRGPLFFAQERVGKNGRVFRILKFRTMEPNTGSTGEWTTEKDPRVTPFGRLLRTTHLDELPQVVNVLRGDLSVVGPRPEQPRYVEELESKLPYYELRHLVRPGLTGWAQVKYHYGADDEDAMEKLQYEFFYLRHQRLGLDARIVGRTIRAVVGRAGR